MKLREGFTTGSCAAAASAGALLMLMIQKDLESVEILLPNGYRHSFELVDQKFTKDSASCAVIKDAGDDIDVTDGVKVYAEVTKKSEPGITLEAGRGIGRVTLKGLSIPPGEPAINPVPRKMIRENLERILKEEKLDFGLSVKISIPEGERLAEKTFNPKLGIVGGISVLGTTGIVRPMSNEALIKSKFLELSVLREKGAVILCLVPGNYGEKFSVENLGVPEDLVIKSSNFLGEILDEIRRLDFKKILYVGDLGKLVKVSAGIFQTHSKVSDARAEILAANAASVGASQKVVNELLNINTTVEGIEILKKYHLESVFKLIGEKVKSRVERRVGLPTAVVLFSNRAGLLYESEGVEDLIGELRDET